MNGKGKVAKVRNISEYITPAHNWGREEDFDFGPQIYYEILKYDGGYLTSRFWIRTLACGSFHSYPERECHRIRLAASVFDDINSDSQSELANNRIQAA